MNDPYLSSDGKIKKIKSAPFNALLFLIFVNYIAPQEYFPFLQKLRPALVIGIIAGLLHMFDAARKNRPVIILDRETKLLFFFLFLAIFSIPFSIWKGGSVGFLLELYSKVIIMLLLIANIVSRIDYLKKLLWLIVGFSYPYAFFAIKNYLTGNFSRGERIDGGVSPLTGNPNDLALVLLLAIPFAIAFLNIETKPFRKFVLAGYVILATPAIICTYSRAAFIGLLVAYGLFFVKKARKNFVGTVLVVLLVILACLPFMSTSYADRISSIFNYENDPTGSAQQRKALMDASLNIICKHPLTGVGIGVGLVALTDYTGAWRSVHNAYLQIAVDLGIPALIVFLAILLMLINDMRRIQKRSADTEMAALAWGLETSLIVCAVAAFFYPVAYYYYFYYLFGFSMALNTIFLERLKRAVVKSEFDGHAESGALV